MLHLDRLTAADTALLSHEDRTNTHMQTGWVMVAEGPPPAYEDLLAHVKARLPLVPRYRQKLLHPPLGFGRPFWIDDPRFNLEYHVRHSALPSPGSLDQLRALTGRIFSQRLDRSKPLWEMWLIQGLEKNRFAVINKAHRAMVDGVVGIDITSVLFDTTRAATRRAAVGPAWIPHPEPTSADVAAASIRDAVAAPRAFSVQLGNLLSSPDTALATVKQLGVEAADMLAAYLKPPSPTPFNVAVGPHRNIVWLRYRFDQLKPIKDAAGATFNDVYIALVSGALTRWFRRRGMSTANLRLRAAVPVLLRTNPDPASNENRIVEVFAPLPIDCSDPVQRLGIVRDALQGLKTSRRALGARNIAALQEFAPPALLAQVGRLTLSTRFFNLVVANVPGPQAPLYLLGREVLQVAPVGFLIDQSALMFLAVGYNGHLEIALTADPDVLPELESIATYFDDAVIELRDAILRPGRKPRATRRSPKRRSRKHGASA